MGSREASVDFEKLKRSKRPLGELFFAGMPLEMEDSKKIQVYSRDLDNEKKRPITFFGRIRCFTCRKHGFTYYTRNDTIQLERQNKLLSATFTVSVALS